jgi:hypothetical protein
MPAYPCDLCSEEQAVLSMNNMLDGSVQFVGVACLPLVGASLILGLDGPVLDAVLKSVGYQPTKATRDARKALEAPEFDVNEPVLTIIEDQPRPPEPSEPPARIDTADRDQAADEEQAMTDETLEQWGRALDAEGPEEVHDDGPVADDPPPY